MGLCASTASSSSSPTSKLILQDGTLQEFSYPVKVSFLLLKDPNMFICNSDEMEFDGVLTAVKENQVLQPGELYFALPLSKLNRPLQPEEMAALAVKANAALLPSAVGENRRYRKKGGFFGCGGEGSNKVNDLESASVDTMKGGDGKDGRRRMFLANLSVIAE